MWDFDDLSPDQKFSIIQELCENEEVNDLVYEWVRDQVIENGDIRR